MYSALDLTSLVTMSLKVQILARTEVGPPSCSPYVGRQIGTCLPVGQRRNSSDEDVIGPAITNLACIEVYGIKTCPLAISLDYRSYYTA